MSDPRAVRPRVGYYGDDLTGSIDVLLQFGRAGWSGRLFVGLPAAEQLTAAVGDVDVVGIAGIARSLPTPALTAEVKPALAALHHAGVDVVQYKTCSTADSSPEIGSIGRVLEIARTVFGNATVPLLFAQPGFGRYTVFGHHFAAEGSVVYRLDRQPTMSAHPITPMRESDLVRHLTEQTTSPISSLALTAYDDAGSVASALRRSGDAGIVLDAMDDDHLRLLGTALWQLVETDRPLFAVGSGGLSTALGSAAPREQETGPTVRATRSVDSPVLAVSGSRSPRTAEQIAHARAVGWAVVSLPLEDGKDVDDVVATLHGGGSVVLSADKPIAEDDAVERIAGAAARTIEAAGRAGAIRRVIVCGGDTSGRVARLLGLRSLRIVENPTGNVAVCAAEATAPWLDGMELVFKGGQVGPVDLFEVIRAN